jgi:hypothetical protein
LKKSGNVQSIILLALQALKKELRLVCDEVEHLRVQHGNLRALVSMRPVQVDTATATSPEGPSETAQIVATLQADFKQLKEKFALHEAKASNLSKHNDNRMRTLQETVRGLLHRDTPHVAARFAALQADYNFVHTRTKEAFSHQEITHSKLVCSLSQAC